MKAIIWTKYGSPNGLQLREVEKPTPKDNEVLIQIHAATASRADTELRRLKLPFLFAIPFDSISASSDPPESRYLGQSLQGKSWLLAKK